MRLLVTVTSFLSQLNMAMTSSNKGLAKQYQFRPCKVSVSVSWQKSGKSVVYWPAWQMHC